MRISFTEVGKRRQVDGVVLRTKPRKLGEIRQCWICNTKHSYVFRHGGKDKTGHWEVWRIRSVTEDITCYICKRCDGRIFDAPIRKQTYVKKRLRA